MKRLIAIFLAALMLLSLAACGNQTNDTEIENNAPSQTSESDESNQNEQNTVQDNVSNTEGKVLIVYFTAAENSGVDAIASASYTTINGNAVGRVRAVADMIQKETGGELFSIQTSTVYPADGGELIDQAADEQNDNFRPELTTHIEDLSAFETIFIGYPNWWYDMPMALYSFFEEYDFSGKTIIPFNVHNGSRFSSTISTIQGLEPNATVITDGFTVSERSVADAEKDVVEWLEELGF